MHFISRGCVIWLLSITLNITSSSNGLSAGQSTLHYTANVKKDISAAVADGFTMFDISGDKENPSKVNALVSALPAGTKALIWVGNLDNAPLGEKCPTPGFSMKQFQEQVDALANNDRVYGYYLSDEPHPSVCPGAVSDIRERADYVHAHTAQKTFIVVLDGYNMCKGHPGCEYQALSPPHTHVDLIGLDPYPCHYDKEGKAVPCDVSQITSRANTAIKNGIPANIIVPVFQTFGQEGKPKNKYYRTPSTDEMRSMLAAWQSIVPSPVMDYSYTYGTQCKASACPAPQALNNTPELKAVMRAHNTEAGKP